VRPVRWYRIYLPDAKAKDPATLGQYLPPVENVR
jgi:hypothetical protein